MYKPLKPILGTLFNLLISFIIVGCGLVNTDGGTNESDDPTPDGVILAQGSFQGLNGNSVSGVAAIYLTDQGSFIARVESLDVNKSKPLTISVIAGGETVYSGTLKSTQGNQNYVMSIQGSPTWNSIVIRTPTIPSPTNEVGVALLTATVDSGT